MGPIGYFHVFLAGILAARLFIVVAMVDEKGGISSESTRLVVDTSRTPFLLRYGCVLAMVSILQHSSCTGFLPSQVMLNWLPMSYPPTRRRRTRLTPPWQPNFAHDCIGPS